MSRIGSHSCAGAVLQDGTELPCICMRCKNDSVACCLDHDNYLVCPDMGVQQCPDFEPEEDEEDGLDL